MFVKISTPDGQTASRTLPPSEPLVINWIETDDGDWLDGCTRFADPVNIAISKYHHPIIHLEVTPS